MTGLTTGGITCVAVQGGLLAAVIANQKKHAALLTTTQQATQKNSHVGVLALATFLIAKLLAHSLLGFALGSIGGLFAVSSSLNLVFQTLAGLFMLATVGNLLNIHPIFRYVVFQPPQFIQRYIRKQTKQDTFFTPAILGLFTVFIPCGVTQAMEIAALSSGSGFAGAAIMAAFTIGTFPLFSAIGFLTHALTGIWEKRFNLAAAVLVLAVAIQTLNGVAVAMNSPITIQKVAEYAEPFITPPQIYKKRLEERNTVQSLAKIENGVQKVKIDITSNGYTPNRILLRQNVPVEIDLETQDVYSCASNFVARAFDIDETLKPTERRTVSFTPTELGEYRFSCGMGMYDGKIIIVKG